MKRIYHLIILTFGLLSCGQVDNTGHDNQSEKQYPEIRQFLIDEFKIKEIELSELDSSLKHKNYPDKELILYPGQFKLRYFAYYDPFGYNPFVVRITSLGDSLIELFTFTDELYYLHNDIKGVITLKNTIELQVQTYNGYLHNQNLEKNLNSLIHKLGYQNNLSNIKNLLNVLFKDVLEMKEINSCEVQELNHKLSEIKTNDNIIQQYIKDLSDLERKCSSSILCLNAKEGGSGYWIFYINEETDSLNVKVEFVGDLVYQSIYM